MITPLLTVLAAHVLQVAQFTPAPLPYETYYMDGGIDYRQAGLVDRVCIVRATGHSIESRRLNSDSEDDRPSAMISASVESGVVVDGSGRGSTVGLVAPTVSDDPWGHGQGGGGPSNPSQRRPAFVVGQRYLALALSPQNGRLYLSLDTNGDRSTIGGPYLDLAHANDLSLVAAFPTNAVSLPVASDPGVRLQEALVDALPATRGWDRGRLLNFLGTLRNHDSTGGPIPIADPVLERIRSVARTSIDPEVRIDALVVLMNWQVPGTEAPFFTALMDAANSTVSLGDLPSNTYFTYEMKDPPADYRSIPDPARANRLAATATNDAIRRYLFEYGVTNPSAADKTAYVRNLVREPKWFVDSVMLQKFADWDKEPDKAPVGEVRNHDALVAYWRAKYGG